MAEHECPTRNRREFVADAFCGFGTLALASLEARAAAKNPLAPKPPTWPDKARAKSVIFLFMAGGPSHVETFDPKPLLNTLHGQKRPADFGEAKYQFVQPNAKLLGTKRTFKKYGKSGLDVSDLFPHTATVVDELAILRGCHGDMVVHSAAQYQLMTGRILPGFPNMGSWVVYGLGTEGDSLPAYCVLPDPKGALEAGQPMYTQGFLPAVYQPTMLRSGTKPVLNLDLPQGTTFSERRETLAFLRGMNEAGMRPGDAELEARVAAYDLSFRMQAEAPEAFDLAKESEETKILYGLEKKETADYGRRCLLARRLVERGVRFVTVVSGGGPGNMQWDAHGDIEENHLRMAAHTDQPVAALIKDLKRRGLLDSTLVVWGGEFGRSPESQGTTGRDHHNLGFTMWMAGGGIKGGQAVGGTDAIGLRAIERPMHFRDIHTTLLHQLGLSQDALSYMHQGRRERLTEVHGEVIKEIV
ncbi:MAG: DUF1501 domain-containing protein [Acidobacteria bacterium]|nr:DUF1501 domain-containing protein [Acidobacteriota bacterium]